MSGGVVLHPVHIDGDMFAPLERADVFDVHLCGVGSELVSVLIVTRNTLWVVEFAAVFIREEAPPETATVVTLDIDARLLCLEMVGQFSVRYIARTTMLQ